MFYYPYHHNPLPPQIPINARTYPPVDIKVFSGSVKSFQLLMSQGSLLLDRLGDANFARRIMTEAQKGNKMEVDRLIHSIGLKVPVKTTFTPTGIIFEISTQTSGAHPVSCCTLTFTIKWGY